MDRRGENLQNLRNPEYWTILRRGRRRQPAISGRSRRGLSHPRIVFLGRREAVKHAAPGSGFGKAISFISGLGDVFPGERLRMQRVYITGVGVCTPVGSSRASFWQSLLEGKSGVRALEGLDVSDLSITIGGQVLDIETTQADINEKVSSRRMDRSSVFSVLSAQQALADAGLSAGDLGDRAGVIIGAGLAGIHTLQMQTENLLNRGPRGVSPLTIPILMPNAAAANVSLAFGITGPAFSVNSACSSSGHALIEAFNLLRLGDVDVMIAGGAESAMTRLGIAAFGNMKAMTKKYNDRPHAASRPFDRDRDGFIMSEGCGVLVLENEASLKRRGTQPYAELVGYGSTSDSFHLVQPDPDAKGAIRAIAQALRMAKLNPSEIARETYVNAHGTSTKFNDLAETIALKEVFGPAAKDLQISSTKSCTGHMIGAACAAELVVCALALREKVLPPTINLDNPDPECDLDYIPHVARPADCRFAIDNSFGFGGHNVSLVLARP